MKSKQTADYLKCKQIADFHKLNKQLTLFNLFAQACLTIPRKEAEKKRKKV